MVKFQLKKVLCMSVVVGNLGIEDKKIFQKVHRSYQEFLNEDDGDVIEDLDDQVKEDKEGEGIVLQTRYPREGTDGDYEYEELLGRVFNILRENNLELAGDRRRTAMRPPQVLREGTKKTVFVNFMDLCKRMNIFLVCLVFYLDYQIFQ
ncbi:hypothetical protein MKW92_050579 [Papaver armeniacum]|nr:hypothetical protein MKW92_050579 [Papaver armeniacum]